MIDYHELAKQTLRDNDLGGYTVPTHGLYPFQWNWDSAIVALGWLPFDEPRAWQEVTTLLSGQWDNGMVPHVVFHQESDKYFPGPDIWGGDHHPKTTSISQPPVLATVVKALFEQGKDRTLAQHQVKPVVEALLNYHIWWYRDRDPEQSGLVVSYHPWESGMDNSPAWDKPLAAVPTVSWQYHRRDTGHVDPSERPHKSQYDRFLYLIDFFKHNDFDAEKIYQYCPYQVYDISIISILHRATKDLLALCTTLNIADERTQTLSARLAITEQAVGQLWCEQSQFFHSKDKLTNTLLNEKTSAGFLPLFANFASPQQTERLGQFAEQWLNATDYAMASTHPDEPGYEPQRYWRGPVWLHINWMIWDGLNQSGFTHVAEQLKQNSKAMIEKAQYCESYHCELGTRSGGARFSWAAAIALYWLLPEQKAANKILCFGEALIDFLSEPSSNSSGSLETFSKFAGGAPANVSAAVAKLGGNSYFVGMLGDDMFGRFLLQSLQQNQVNTDHTLFTNEYKTGLAFVSLDESGERSFEFYRDDSADLHFGADTFERDWFNDAGIFHCCSNSLTTKESLHTTLAGLNMASQAGWLTSFDVNLRLGLWNEKEAIHQAINQVLSVSHVIKFSQEEIDYMRQSQEQHSYVQTLFEQQAKLVLVTDGAKPLLWYTADKRGSVTPPQVDMLDATAAGDAFMGALLVNLSQLQSMPWQDNNYAQLADILCQACCAGAMTATKKGALDAIPFSFELELFVNKAAHHDGII